MIACDTSVLVAAFARWHESHRAAARALVRVDALIEHAAVETFSVLTRLPSPRRASPDLVGHFLKHHFPTAAARLPHPSSAVVIDRARTAGIVGGAVYDLVVGLSAAEAEATVLSLDRRAAATYAAADVRYEFLSTA